MCVFDLSSDSDDDVIEVLPWKKENKRPSSSLSSSEDEKDGLSAPSSCPPSASSYQSSGDLSGIIIDLEALVADEDEDDEDKSQQIAKRPRHSVEADISPSSPLSSSAPPSPLPSSSSNNIHILTFVDALEEKVFLAVQEFLQAFYIDVPCVQALKMFIYDLNHTPTATVNLILAALVRIAPDIHDIGAHLHTFLSGDNRCVFSFCHPL